MTVFKIIDADSRRGRRLIESLCRRGETVLDPEVTERAGRIVDAVKHGGDRALLKAVRRYDHSTARSIDELRLDVEAEETEALEPGVEEALERAIAAVERFHEPQVHPGFRLEQDGVELIERRRAFRRVGVYVPGGRAAYPSTVVMTVVPARIAGVEEIAVVTPPLAWEASCALRWVLRRLGVTEVWGMGGAQAVAALAHGTESIERVDKIVGPGNAWVTAAKHLVSTDVAIDGLAGPSEVVIVAGSDADPALVAADLLAQAEHDPRALALLVTDRRKQAKQVAKELSRQLPELATAAVAKRALSAALVVHDMDAALDVVEQVAPEHLQLIGAGAEELADRVTTSPAIFVGPSTPVVFGDYIAGPSHVLPTAGTARFTSALGVEDFVKRSHVVRFDAAAARRTAAAAAKLADAEGLPAHAAAARRRLADPAGGELVIGPTPAEPAREIDPAAMVRPELRQLSAYHLDRSPCRFKLDQNEMPFDLPAPVERRVLDSLADRDWGAYPDFNADRLRAAFGRQQDWPAEGVLWGNGSGELLALTVEAVTRPGQEVLGTLPSFSLYKLLVLRASAVPRFLPPREDLKLPLAELEAEIVRDPTRPLILCSPNNPTGEAVTPEALERLLERLEAPLLLDNAYHEFCRYDYRPLLDRHRHLMIFRTLSKAWTLAAWRLGYLLADPELVAELVKVKLPYNLSFASGRAAEAVLATRGAVDRRVRAVLGRRPQWARMLEDFGFEVFSSDANFLLVRHPRAEALRQGLDARSIRVRDVGYYPGLAGCFRISIGSGAALRATRQALSDILGVAS